MRDKDFVLRHDETGALCVDGVAVRGSALANRVYLILEIVTGTFIANESIGSRLGEVRKATERSAMNAGLYAVRLYRY